jgi:hypothetical protein
LERLRMRHVDEEFVRPAEMMDQKKKAAAAAANTTTDTDAVSVRVGESVKDDKPIARRTSTANIPSPANPADLLTSPGPKAQRRESTSTVGSDESALEVFGQTQTGAGTDKKSNSV